MNSVCPIGRDLEPLKRVLSRIEDPAARKIVIMGKLQRGEISNHECERLIAEMGLVEA